MWNKNVLMPLEAFLSKFLGIQKASSNNWLKKMIYIGKQQRNDFRKFILDKKVYFGYLPKIILYNMEMVLPSKKETAYFRTNFTALWDFQ